ncbi:hypothetical protein EON65_44750 [archaeon]|nr:MAG: hypothetical protein EON65_44750 [archaeon]
MGSYSIRLTRQGSRYKNDKKLACSIILQSHTSSVEGTDLVLALRLMTRYRRTELWKRTNPRHHCSSSNRDTALTCMLAIVISYNPGSCCNAGTGTWSSIAPGISSVASDWRHANSGTGNNDTMLGQCSAAMSTKPEEDYGRSHGRFLRDCPAR